MSTDNNKDGPRGPSLLHSLACGSRVFDEKESEDDAV